MEPEYVEVGAETVRAIEKPNGEKEKLWPWNDGREGARISGFWTGHPASLSRRNKPIHKAGYRFQIVEGLLTIYLPQTTLLMLVSAFAGTEFLGKPTTSGADAVPVLQLW
jgi:S-adenosylmethionine:tRNA-ribosyltransferase-isomerase (queuine synthetase)